MNEKLRCFSSYHQPLFVPLCGITLPDSKYSIFRPNSEVTVIEYVYSGEGFIKIDGKLTHIGADTVYLLCAGTDHEYYSDPDNPWEKVFINLGGKLAATLPFEFGLSKQGAYSGDGMWDIFEQISALVNREAAVDDEAELIGSFTEAVSRLSRRSAEACHNSDAARIKAFIDANTGRIVSNEELAELIYRSRDYCIKHFYAEYGITPYDYQLANKIYAAKNLLKNTAMSIADIAEAIGYSDPQYFSGLFKSKVGISPREYRKSRLSN